MVTPPWDSTLSPAHLLYPQSNAQRLQLPCRPQGLSPAGALRPLPLSPSGHLRVSKEKLLGAEALGEESQAFPSFPVELQEEDKRVVTCPGTTTLLRGAEGGTQTPVWILVSQ